MMKEKIDYTALEVHPLSAELVGAMGYVALLNAQKEASFSKKYILVHGIRSN